MKKLTQDEKRARIAEACGFVHYGCIGCACTPCVCRCYLTPAPACDLVYNIPDYFNDLNAIHEAEKILHDGYLQFGKGGRSRYERNLAEKCSLGGSVSATAAQRAEAFGRTLNLWEEGQ